MKYSIKHNLNKCQLGPASSPPFETSLYASACRGEGGSKFLRTVEPRAGILGTPGSPCWVPGGDAVGGQSAGARQKVSPD